MKVCYTVFSPNTPVRNLYQQGVDYLRHEFDFGSDDAVYLLKELMKSSDRRNDLTVESSSCFLDFHVSAGGELWVEVYGNNNCFWAISEIDLTIGEEIIRIAHVENDFGETIPTTDRNWDAYTPMKN